MNGDLISRDALKEHKFLTPQVKVIGGRHNGKMREQIIQAYQKGWNDAIDAIINNAPTVSHERLQGDCEKCDFRKFTETFIDGVVDVMNKNGITSVEQLSKILKGGAYEQ